MKKIILLTLLLLPSIAFAQPVITFESEAHDFGRVTEGDHPEYTFQLVNSGSETLVIDRLEPS